MAFVYVYCGLCWLWMLYKLCQAISELPNAGPLNKAVWINIWRRLREFIAAPLVVPIDLFFDSLCWALTWRDRKVNRELRRYRDYLFDPVEPDELPADVFDYLDEHTGPLEALGFRVIDDYWLWREPLPYVERVLISADGRSFAAISSVEEIRYVSFFSVLEDGAYVETALGLYENPHTDVGDDPSRQLQSEVHVEGTIGDLFLRHDERLDHATHEAFRYEARDVRAVAIYGSRLLGEQLYASGERDEPPPRAELPEPVWPCVVTS